MTRHSDVPRDELTDEELNVLLDATQAALGEQVRRTADPTIALVAIMTADGGNAIADSVHGLCGKYDLDRARMVAVLMTRIQVRALSSALDASERSDSGHHFQTREVVRTLAYGLDAAYTLADTYALHISTAISRSIDTGTVFKAEPAGGLGHAIGAAHILSHALARARDLVRDIDEVLSGRVEVIDLATAINNAHLITSELDAIELDVSDTDLSHLDLTDLDTLTGVLWTDDTIWPPGLEDKIRSSSKEVQTGTYQVCRGNERDPVSLVPA